jgi:uncharacterized protein YjaZ
MPVDSKEILEMLSRMLAAKDAGQLSPKEEAELDQVLRKLLEIMAEALGAERPNRSE